MFFVSFFSTHQNIPKDDRHELVKCKEYLKEAEARREELDLRIDANRAALFVLKRKGEKNVDRCVARTVVPSVWDVLRSAKGVPSTATRMVRRK